MVHRRTPFASRHPSPKNHQNPFGEPTTPYKPKRCQNKDLRCVLRPDPSTDRRWESQPKHVSNPVSTNLNPHSLMVGFLRPTAHQFQQMQARVNQNLEQQKQQPPQGGGYGGGFWGHGVYKLSIQEHPNQPNLTLNSRTVCVAPRSSCVVCSSVL